jgi:hypothetical protein
MRTWVPSSATQAHTNTNPYNEIITFKAQFIHNKVMCLHMYAGFSFRRVILKNINTSRRKYCHVKVNSHS